MKKFTRLVGIIEDEIRVLGNLIWKKYTSFKKKILEMRRYFRDLFILDVRRIDHEVQVY